MRLYYENDNGKLYNCDVLEGLRSQPDNSVDLIVTSPPYWGLRDYGVEGQKGLEPDLNDFIKGQCEVFGEAHRVLKPTGNLYVNMGDSYSGSGKGTWKEKDRQKNTYVPDPGGKHLQCKSTLPAKNLLGQPWRLAFALQDMGWWLREDIIWHKPNPMCESVRDRCTRAHEYIFHFTKSAKYYYDAYSIRTEYAPKTITTWGNSKCTPADGSGLVKSENFAGMEHQPKVWKRPDGSTEKGFGANKNSVWEVSVKPLPYAHFAMFPKDLISPIIQAACPQGGLVLDIYGGSGTTAVVAENFQRQWMLFELNAKYCDIAKRRIESGDNLGKSHEPSCELSIETFLKETEADTEEVKA